MRASSCSISSCTCGGTLALREGGGESREEGRGKRDAPTPALPLPEEGVGGANAPHPSPFPLLPSRAPAVRLGLRMVKGLSRAGAERLVAARKERAPFPSRLTPPASPLTPHAFGVPPPAS